MATRRAGRAKIEQPKVGHDNAGPPVDKFGTRVDDDKAGAAINALIDFSFADMLKIPPKRESVQIFARAWRKWFSNEGKLTLDKCLGLSAKRGRDPVYKQLQISTRNSVYLHKMVLLRALGFTISEAAKAVAAGEFHSKHGSKSWRLAPLTEKSVRALYIRENGKQMLQNATAPEGKTRADFLAQFPPDYIPGRLKR